MTEDKSLGVHISITCFHGFVLVAISLIIFVLDSKSFGVSSFPDLGMRRFWPIGFVRFGTNL